MEISKALNQLSVIDLAVFWGNTNHRVLPVSGRNKRPAIKAWQDAASTEENQIRFWWYDMPDARVGIATGAPGFDVVDFDVAGGKPGLEQMGRLIDLAIIAPGTFWLVGTPSGGRHLYFSGSQQRNKQNERSIPGVDFRGVGGMVLAAGNPGYEVIAAPWAGIGPVDWEQIRAALAPADTPPPPPANRTAPAGAYTPPPPPGPPRGSGSPKSRVQAPMQNGHFDDPVGEESPLDWYTRNHDIDRILVDAGWQFDGERQGRNDYVRPGKKRIDGVSGNVSTMPDGRRVFFNFSSSVDLPTNTALSAAQLYAYMHHNGDMRGAAGHIRRSMMPARPVVPPAAQAPPARVHTPQVVLSTETALEVIEGVPRPVAEFWDQRRDLYNIRWLAKQRRVNPWAVLGAVLAQVACRIGPHVVLPPSIGTVGSLNLLVGLVGPSGLGKGAATGVADEYMQLEGQFMVEEVGSPQAIDSCFAEGTSEGVVQFNDVALMSIPEIDTITGHAKQQGGSQLMMATIRKVFSGESLGARYATKDLRRTVPKHCYRAAMIVGIQPSRSGLLLDDANGGTPQRWLWMPVQDPEMRRRTDKLKSPLYSGSPPQVTYDVWVPHGEQRDEKNKPLPVEIRSRYEIPVCQSALDMIDDIHVDKHHGKADSLDTHTPYTRLKVAALLAFLDRRAGIREDDWALSAQVMWVSNQTRVLCQDALRDVQEKEARERGRNRAMQMVTEDIERVVVRDKHATRVAELASRALGLLADARGDWVSPRDVRTKIGNATANRDYGDDVWRSLRATPGVEEGPEELRSGKPVRRWRYSQ